MKKRIGILTGGGDVPGLNTIIRDITYRAVHENSFEVIGIKRGWGGLVYMDPDRQGIDAEHAIILTSESVRKIDRDGGTILHSSRVNPSKMSSSPMLKEYRGIEYDKSEKRDFTQDVLKNLGNLGIDLLIVVGGDDTLSYALQLHKQGVPVIGIPKTMDGDVAGTDYCIGFSTAISKASNYVTELRTVMGSHQRFGVIELFGRNSGFTALYTALAAKSDRVLIPEVDFSLEKAVELLAKDKRENPSGYSLVLVSEGAKPIGGKIIYADGRTDDYDHKKLGGIGNVVAKYIQECTGEDVISEALRYLLRSGPPDAKDKIMASVYANVAFNGILRGESGVMAANHGGHNCLVPLEFVQASPRKVNVGLAYNTERYCPNYTNFEERTLLL